MGTETAARIRSTYTSSRSRVAAHALLTAGLVALALAPLAHAAPRGKRRAVAWVGPIVRTATK
jgi:hypothetical protein